ncbi:MAG: ATP-binding protein [Prolixibacteraceae bacterium]
MIKNKVEILIVEDSLTQAEELKYILQENDFLVVHAICGEDALEKLNDFTPDIIISDIVMPGIDGYQFSKMVNANKHLKHIPIILLTSLSNPQDVMKGLECGADSFLVKPYDEDLLIERIHYFIKNAHLRKLNTDQSNLEIFFDHQTFNIQSSPRQILDVLLATYQNSLLINKQLLESNKELKLAQDKLTQMNSMLEQKVKVRTQELELINRKLEKEIVERKRATEEIVASEYKFKAITEYSPLAIYMSSGIEQKAQYINPAFTKMFGYQIEEVSSVAEWWPLAYPVDNYRKQVEEEWQQKVKKSIESRTEIEPMEVEVTSKDGTIKNISWGFISSGTQNWAFGMDLTDRKNAERTLKENEMYLKELNSAKDKFFSIISHDLKNPFNSIIGLSDLLIERIQEKDYKGIEEFVKAIQDTAQHTMSLLLNLLEWANSQTGNLKYQPEHLNIESLFNEVFSLVKPLANEKSILISTDVSSNSIVCADKAMISTVIRNLISNAIKFTYPLGKIEISVVQNKDETLVTIADSGVGINRDKIKDLFCIDKNTSTQGTQNEKGTGLGLHLCKEFIEKHGGQIWAESELGKGTSFHFSIPNFKEEI